MSGSDTYVQVLYDFHYVTDDGNEVSMKEGEELLVLKKANDDWWQVIRNSEKQPFYAPSNYLDIICQQQNNDNEQNKNATNDENANIPEFRNAKPQYPETVSRPKNIFPPDISKLSSEISLKEQPKNNSQLKGPFSFSNPLCTTDNFKTSAASRADEKLGENELENELSTFKTPNNLNTSTLETDRLSSLEDSTSPVYVNIPFSTSSSPPTPKPDDVPQRTLSNNWLEYVDGNGRKYYFNSETKKVTWKPPRKRDNYQSTPISSQQCSPKLDDSSLCVPDPPPKQLKPKLKKLAHSSTESLDSPTSVEMFTILPPGWSQECDLESGAVYYINDASKKRWFSSLDENGRTYFYDEDSSESLWELPDLSVTSDTEDSTNETRSASQSVTEEASAKNISAKEVTCTSESASSHVSSAKLRSNKAPKLPVPRHYKARSLVVPDSVHPINFEDGKSSLPRSFAEGYWPVMQDGHLSVVRKGTLNKTKLIESGRRVRKSWSSSFVVLTDVFLLFYKDIRSAQMGMPGVKPELCIDLNGALVDWCPDKSSRKNVFQISTVLGHQILLQDDNAQTSKEWFDAIQAAIMNLPSSFDQLSAKDFVHEKEDSPKKDIKLSRSKSTKQSVPTKGSDEDVSVMMPAEKKRKIRDKLRHFFVRRPTMESLREKGIILDEPVFGCHLENLCQREKTTVPRFVVKCLETIEKKELTADGLYRASGNLSQIQKIRFHVNQDDYFCLDDEDDVHVLTGALKMFFREMKEPLFPFHMFDKFLTAIALPDSQSKLRALKELVQKMPEPNYDTLKFLLQHLLKVTEYHKQNRMQVQNLAIVFGPTLLRPEEESANIALDMMYQNRIVEFLLLEFSAIFK